MDRRPLLVAGLVALAATGLLAVAVASGWLGPDVGRGAEFCEAARDWMVKQPANTYSNAGFVIAGLLVAWHAGRPIEHGMPRAMATAYACVVVLLGPASAAMHATQSVWGGHLDLLSMHLIASFAASYAVMRWLRRGPGTFGALFVTALVVCEMSGLWPHEVPVVRIAGNVVFATLLITALVFEALLWRRAANRRTIGFGFAALGSMLVAFAIWNLAQHGWCDPHSLLQGHAVWHLLCAVAAYLLFRLHDSERTLVAPGRAIHPGGHLVRNRSGSPT